MVHKAAKTAMNLSSPPDERREALSELQQTYYPTTSDLPHQGDVQQLVDFCLDAYQDPPMAKGSAGTASAFHSVMQPTQKRLPDGPKTIFVDELGGFGTPQGGYRRRPSQFGAEHLRMMVEHTPLLNAIISRRQRTIQRFLRPYERDRDVGFEIRKRDDERPLRVNDDEMERHLTEFVRHSGMANHPIRMRQLKRDTLSQFMNRSIRDLLTLDAWAIETVMTRNNRQLAGYHAVDAGTIYLVSEEGYGGNDQITSIQLVNGMPVNTYTDYELTYLAQNPRTDVLHAGYGYPPTEMIIKVVTGYLNAMTYNLKGFDSNAVPKGILTLFGSYDTRELNAFKQQWNAMVKGVNNSWALPVMVSDSKDNSAHYEKFGNEFSEMYFSKWMIFLTSVICSIYGMDPSEVNTETFHAGKSSLSGSDMAERMADARDTGLEPLMSFIESVMTDHVLSRVAPDYKFRFFGLQPVDRAWRQESIKLTKTVNEAREIEGDPPMNDPILGNAPLNAALMGAYLQGLQAKQADEQAGAQGAPDDRSNGAQPQGNDAGEVQGDGAEGQAPDQAQGTSPTAEESGDRVDLAQGSPAQLEEQGDREDETEDSRKGAKPTRDKFFGSSTMAKSRPVMSEDMVVVG